ncbi:MAG: hypothetical protein IKU24_06090 [Clostridia bacterium]|nr:hypothetical protein [Clostridia bacterium]
MVCPFFEKSDTPKLVLVGGTFAGGKVPKKLLTIIDNLGFIFLFYIFSVGSFFGSFFSKKEQKRDKRLFFRFEKQQNEDLWEHREVEKNPSMWYS